MKFPTPGMKTSEFLVAVLTAALTLANASANWVSWREALMPTLAAVGYILSRGFAKTEPRDTTVTK